MLCEGHLKNYNLIQNSGEIYECGVSGVEEPLKKLELQFLVISIFFILYEIEFLLLLPVFLFSDSWHIMSSLLILFSFLLVLIFTAFSDTVLVYFDICRVFLSFCFGIACPPP